ncbi:RNA-guided endonuclease InsQ/TnpB family protein [Streptomyces sp. NPDC050523]|uniref:RNA-guided endonuclease InsQ/TnpB family protein n=1 Tax=Streptomyces sp. NPDC050523 TaxID=3365622 RepID=UPI0037885FAC
MGEQGVKRAFKYRFYPSAEQAEQLLQTFGCVRKVFNLALEARSRAWTEERRRISYGQTSAMLTEWKRTEELSYLAEVSSVPLQQALRHLQSAFTSFFTKRSAYPRFKSRKRSRAAAEYTRSAFTWRNGRLTLAKMRGPIDIRWSRPLPDGADPSTVKVAAPGFGKREGARLAKAQKEFARKKKGSRNQAKARQKVARIHAGVADRRRDHLHKLSTRIVQENQLVAIEDLPVRNLMGNRNLARAISDASWSALRVMLEYKCAWYGRELVVVDRFFPSSKTCSACGLICGALPLGARAWTCEGCGTRHDRDHNAAQNILAAGQAVSACGGRVSPQRSSSGRAAGDEAGSLAVRAVRVPAPAGREDVKRRTPGTRSSSRPGSTPCRAARG